MLGVGKDGGGMMPTTICILPLHGMPPRLYISDFGHPQMVQSGNATIPISRQPMHHRADQITYLQKYPTPTEHLLVAP